MATTHNPHSDLTTKIKRDLATLLYEQGTYGCFVVIIIGAATTFGTTNFKPNSFQLVWCLFLVTLSVYRIIDIQLFLKKVAGTDFDGQHYINRFTYSSLLAGSLFAIFPFISFADSDFLGRSVFILVVAGLAGGATTVLSADRRLALAYLFLLLAPESLLALVRVEYDLQIMGLLGLLYWVVLSLSVLRSSKFIYKAAKLRHHNEELIIAIGEEKDLVERSNEKLQLAYAKINSANEALEHKVELRTQALSILASTDELTGLKNRHTFVRTLNAAIDKAASKGQMFSILFVDLDGFKEINDIRGHIIGDKVLKTIASRLQKNVKNKDFLCRWGGDEFVLIVDESEPLLLDTISTRVCQTIQQEINIDFDHIKITSSIGIATYPTHGLTTTELVNAADVAMYELKKGGKNGTMLFEAAFLEKIRFEQHLLNGLNHAVEKQQFDLFYQPIVPSHADAPIIFEGLIRWKFDGAHIPPVIFIPIAESCDTIFEIGNWIVTRACRDLHHNRLGPNSRVSINISVKQLLSRGFVDFMKEKLNVNHVEPWRLHIEITESVFVNNLNQANIVLNQLRDLGLTIALDDFGCGFSSLSYLQSLPIDTIKIDRSFVQQIESGGAKIIEATVSIAEAFGCTVVAEGIETERQYDLVKQLGVDYMQGFYLAIPSQYSEIDSCWIAEEDQRKISP